jgi:hypothetical protein
MSYLVSLDAVFDAQFLLTHLPRTGLLLLYGLKLAFVDALTNDLRLKETHLSKFLSLVLIARAVE